MPTFVFTYRAPKGYVRTPETGLAWREWFENQTVVVSSHRVLRRFDDNRVQSAELPNA